MLQRLAHRKQKSFALQRGLFVVRYDSAIDMANPPVLTFKCTPGANEVVAAPGETEAVMSAVGHALVIRAFAPGHLHVELAGSTPAALEATLKFEQIRGHAEMQQTTAMAPPAAVGGGYVASAGVGMPVYPPMAAAIPQQSPYPAADAEVQVLGHLARLGDVTVANDQWLGGPSAPTRIEGFLLRWLGKPADVSLRYKVIVTGQRPSDARFVEVGEFAGTRGKGRPILGYTIELVGPGASRYSLAVESMFLGAPTRRSSGQAVQGAGPSGHEPLVGLRIAVAVTAHAAMTPPMQQARPAAAVPPRAAPAVPPRTAPAAPPTDPRRVRVFRA